MKLRSVDTAFWSDPYVETLDPSEKLLFLYLLTNPLTTLSGIYEISVRRIGNETGLDRDVVQNLLKRLEDAGKVFYFENYIILPNYQTHQNYNAGMEKNVITQMAKLPKDVLKFYEGLVRMRPDAVDTVIIPPALGTQEKTIEQRIKEWIIQVRDFNALRNILKDEDENDFISYWTEHSTGSHKFRAEMEKVFDIGRRMQTWAKNATVGFKKNKPVVVGTGRVVSDKDTEQFKKMMEEANKKIATNGTYNPNNDPEYLRLMGRAVNG